MFDLEDDNALRRLCYFTGILLIAVPMIGALAASWPVGLGNVRWRMAATNNFTQAMQLPFLGAVMILFVARVVKDNAIGKVIGILSGITVVFLVIAMGLFTLDALQLKAIVRTSEMAGYQLAILRVAVALFANLLAFAVLAYVAMKSPAGTQKVPAKGSKKAAADEPVGFLIGQDLSK